MCVRTVGEKLIGIFWIYSRVRYRVLQLQLQYKLLFRNAEGWTELTYGGTHKVFIHIGCV